MSPASPAQETHTLPLVLPASDAGIEGFVRVVNLSDRAGTVRIHAIDDTGERFGPVTLALDANETVNFRSRELEQGNATKGLPSGVGDGEGYWRLELESVLHVGPLAYVRTADGFLTSMHDLVPETGGRHQVLFFNPGECAPGGEVRLTLPVGATALTAVSATGAAGGRLEAGAPWRVRLTAFFRASPRSRRWRRRCNARRGGSGGSPVWPPSFERMRQSCLAP